MYFHKALHVSAACINLLTGQNLMFSYTALYSMPPWLNVPMFFETTLCSFNSPSNALLQCSAGQLDKHSLNVCLFLALFLVVEDAYAGLFKGSSKQTVWRAYLVCHFNSDCTSASGQNKSMSNKAAFLRSCYLVPSGLGL